MKDEVWKPIYGGMYMISSYGRLMRITPSQGTAPGKILKPRDTGRGYLAYGLSTVEEEQKHYIQRSVQQLVAEAFLENPRSLPQVNHIDGVKHHNHVSNLEWVSNRENGEHAARMGLLKHGGNHPSTKLTEQDVVMIRHRYSRGESMMILAEEYSLTIGTTFSLIRGRTWKHVPGAIPMTKAAPNARLTAEQVRGIRQEWAQGASQKELCFKYHVSKATVSEIVNNKIWTHILPEE